MDKSRKKTFFPSEGKKSICEKKRLCVRKRMFSEMVVGVIMVQLDAWLIDKRIVKRHITNNLLTEKEFKSYLASLKDSSSSAAEIDVDEIESLMHSEKS